MAQGILNLVALMLVGFGVGVSTQDNWLAVAAVGAVYIVAPFHPASK